MQKDISIIIVSWNAKHFLSECLKSCIREINKYSAEIIVVDNASSDGSAEYVLEHFRNVRLIRNEENLGFARANNIGIRESSGKYLFLINSDIKITEGCFDRMIEFMNNDDGIGILGPQILNQSGKVQRTCMDFPTLWNTLTVAFALYRILPRSKIFGGGAAMSYWKYDKTREVDVINGCFWLVRREALNDVGLLDERFFIYGEDIDWCKRFDSAGWKVLFFSGAQAIHYGGGSSSNDEIRFFIERQKANLQLWEKYHGRFSREIYSVISICHHIIRLLGYTGIYMTEKERRGFIKLKIRKSGECICWIICNRLRGSIL